MGRLKTLEIEGTLEVLSSTRQHWSLHTLKKIFIKAIPALRIVSCVKIIVSPALSIPSLHIVLCLALKSPEYSPILIIVSIGVIFV